MTHHYAHIYMGKFVEKGLQSIRELLRVLTNAAIQAERHSHRQTGGVGCLEDRTGPANGICRRPSSHAWTRSPQPFPQV
jgi:hypothetical protein